MSNSTTQPAADRGYVPFEQHRRAVEQAFRILGEEASLCDLDCFTQAFIALPIPLQALFATDANMMLVELVEAIGDSRFYDTLIDLGIDV